ncbi:MAG: T9SS type A sorting domain-containing protein [Saprospiraceae bacterium]|nr:T9SS type A sorting domain-containing protein [Saprospiraceae bacterium]
MGGNEVSAHISPNPADGAFTIKNRGGVSDFNVVSITDINGRERLVFKSIYSGNEIDISTLASGMYIVTVTYNDGAMQQQKLMVQH